MIMEKIIIIAVLIAIVFSAGCTTTVPEGPRADTYCDVSKEFPYNGCPSEEPICVGNEYCMAQQ